MIETAKPLATRLPGRALLALGGADTIPFLQGLITNDATRLSPSQGLFAALLTPQGKFLHELIIAPAPAPPGHGDGLLVDTEAERCADLQRRLTLYRLRAKVTIAAPADGTVVAVFGPGSAAAFGLDAVAGAARELAGGAVALVDPRLADLGVRLLGPAAAVDAALAAAGLSLSAAAEAYDRHRLDLAVPDGSRDIAVDRGFLLENNYEELNGVSFTKGCYVGQELTARTKHRATIKKRLYKVEFDPAAEPPEPDTPILLGGHEAGAMRSSRAGVGLALMRLEYLKENEADDHVFTAGSLVVRPCRPAFLGDL
ncbi:YgfZ/GcvT domain-containing protein [Zavarzinia compransoris]|nr:folate-binding protein YgfZ [Zavarzinia compransoris]TDP48717.1 hypothetical protein DES42_10173 [Zavarzinia compransoris]